MTRNQFRILVVLNQLLVLAAVVVVEMFERSFPAEMRSDPGTDVSVMNPESLTAASVSYVHSWFGTAILFVGLTAAVGLFFGQRWGRTLFLLNCVATLFFSFSEQIYLSNNWSVFVSYLASLSDGAILALAYFSHVKRIFDKPRDD